MQITRESRYLDLKVKLVFVTKKILKNISNFNTQRLGPGVNRLNQFYCNLNGPNINHLK